MYIKKISVFKCEINIGFRYSTWETKSSQAMLIKIETNNNLVGWGEYTINKWSTEEILSSSCSDLLNKNVLDINTGLILKPITHINSIDEYIVGFDRRRRLVREGLSIALFDLIGKIKKKPIYELFDTSEVARKKIDAMPVIHVHSKKDRVKILKNWEEIGISNFKIKITGNIDNDKEHLSYLLENMEKDSRIIIVDTNYGYTNKKDVIELSKYTFDSGIGYIQNPIKLSLLQTAKLMNKCQTKFTADNTPWWPNSKRVINKKACVVINHHPNIQGGLDWLMNTAEYAKSHNIPNIIGSSGTFGIQNSAYQMMSAITGFEFPCEEITLEPYAKYQNKFYSFNDNPNVIMNMNKLEENGKIYLNNGYGLGTDVDEEKVKKFTIWSKEYSA